jgi:hypothetical protein
MRPPRRAAASFIDACFAILLYASLCYLVSGLPYYLNYFFGSIFGSLSLLQIFGLYRECIGDDWMLNPTTGEWRRKMSNTTYVTLEVHLKKQQRK